MAIFHRRCMIEIRIVTVMKVYRMAWHDRCKEKSIEIQTKQNRTKTKAKRQTKENKTKQSIGKTKPYAFNAIEIEVQCQTVICRDKEKQFNGL